MPFNPNDFLSIAKSLLSDTNYAKECTFRTCVSRAYYAAFLVCRAFLETKHGYYFPPKSDAHRLVMRRLRERKVIKSLLGPYGQRFTVADALKDLRENGRNKADYDTIVSVAQSDAQSWIQQAEYVIGKIP